jgi:hypothetical protein
MRSGPGLRTKSREEPSSSLLQRRFRRRYRLRARNDKRRWKRDRRRRSRETISS